MIARNKSFALLCVVGVLSATSSLAAETAQLKNTFQDRFRIGAAIGTREVMGDEPAALDLAAQQFNSITPENLLKWQEVHPQLNDYNFKPVDRFVQFGNEHQMFIVGHTLVWHNQTPAWVFEDDSGKPLTREALLGRLRDHIHTIVGRYKGRIQGWDVVNEGIDDDGALRKTKWQSIIGDDYIEQAFRFAHEADPDAELYYNDYNEWHPKKRAAIKQLVQRLKANGVRIDGIGLQGHWGLHYPSVDEIETMFGDYATLGVKLMITELDITVLPDAGRHRGADVARSEALRKELNPYPGGLPAAIERKLAARYAEVFRSFNKHAEQIDRVTFWGVHDGHSWRNNWPIRGRSDYPLLFDRQLRPKSSLQAVIRTATSK